MSERMHYRVSGRTIRIRLEGDYTTSELVDTLGRALGDPAATIPVLLLVDARRSTASHEPSDVRKVVDKLKPLTARIERLAIVTSSDLHYGLARMGSVLIEDAGVASAVFRDYFDALAYLGIGRRDPP